MAILNTDQMAELLRDADFALERSTVALIAFVGSPFPQSVERDCERNDDVRKAIKEALVDLPPEPPLTPEQQTECEALIGKALRKRGWRV
jgi:transcriptional regulator of met regulon